MKIEDFINTCDKKELPRLLDYGYYLTQSLPSAPKNNRIDMKDIIALNSVNHIQGILCDMLKTLSNKTFLEKYDETREIFKSEKNDAIRVNKVDYNTGWACTTNTITIKHSYTNSDF